MSTLSAGGRLESGRQGPGVGRAPGRDPHSCTQREGSETPAAGWRAPAPGSPEPSLPHPSSVYPPAADGVPRRSGQGRPRTPRAESLQPYSGAPPSLVLGLRPAATRPAAPELPSRAARLCPRGSCEAGCHHYAPQPPSIPGHPVPERAVKVTPEASPISDPSTHLFANLGFLPFLNFLALLARFLCVSEVGGAGTPHSQRLLNWGGDQTAKDRKEAVFCLRDRWCRGPQR